MKQKTSGRVGHNVRAHHNSSSCARVCAAHIMTGSLNATPAERKLSECLDANDSGAADSAGHRCGFYNNHSTVCGANDDSDFSASAICCACGGGAQVATPSAAPTAFSTTTPEATLSPTAASAETSCADSNNGATDPYGDGCEYYETYPGDLVATMMMTSILFRCVVPAAAASPPPRTPQWHRGRRPSQQYQKSPR